jgi:hypothetical protein
LEGKGSSGRDNPVADFTGGGIIPDKIAGATAESHHSESHHY